jgi:hypothetical protein
MKNINDLLSDLASDGATHIIANPGTIRDAQKQGIKFDQQTLKSGEEEIETLFEKRKDLALENVNKFPEAPETAIPTIESLYSEIRECILLGLYGAAISLSAILVEFSLKHAIINKKCGSTYDDSEWKKIENKELGPVLTEAKQLGLIDIEWEKKLRDFKNAIRNPYLHYNIQKLTENVVAQKVKKVNIKTQVIEEADVRAKDNPIVWSLSKRFVDKEYVFQTFYFVDTLIKYLFPT